MHQFVRDALPIIVGFPRHRGWFSLLAPHNTAVVIEKATGKEFVVDSWFHKNGELPEVVSVDQWLSGYDPDDKKLRKK